jgi:quinol monooxygenase YgiN
MVGKVKTLPGCRSVRLLRSTEDPAHLAVVEEWESIEAHQKAASAIPPETMKTAKALFARPPVGEYYQ